ncbi:MAG: DUF1801 domain-containing protein [Thermoanaerobaculia bacterium]
MAENKTQETDASVTDFIAGVENPTRREDARALLELMRRVTRTEPKMWGPSIVGFGKCHYKYESGREGDMPRIGFSPRKANLVLYLASKDDTLDDLLSRLGKHKTSVSCLYVNRLSDVDLKVLETMVRRSWQVAHERYGPQS